MVVVSFDFRAVKVFRLRRINRQRIAFFNDFRAAFGQFCSQGDNALAFLDAQTAEVGEFDKFFLKGESVNGAM